MEEPASPLTESRDKSTAHVKQNTTPTREKEERNSPRTGHSDEPTVYVTQKNTDTDIYADAYTYTLRVQAVGGTAVPGIVPRTVEHASSDAYLPGPDYIVVAQQVAGVAERVGREVDLLSAQRPRPREGLHQAPKLQGVQAVPNSEEGREEALRLFREAVHICEVAGLVHLIR